MLTSRRWLLPSRVQLEPAHEVSLRIGLKRLDRDALEAVFRLYWPSLLAQARVILPADLDPEDAAGDVMLYVVRWGGSFDTSLAIYPWLANICYRVCSRRSRRRVRAQRAEAPVAIRDATSAAPAPELDDVLARALDRLTSRCREAVALRYLFGLSPQEIAELLGLDLSAVSKALVRGLRALRTGPDASALREWLDAWGNVP